MASSALADPDVLAVLRTLYRVRPATVTALRQFDSIPRDRVDEILVTLEAAGYLQRTGDTLNLISPDLTTATSLISVMNEQLAAIAAASSAVQHLPILARDWELGIGGEDSPLAAEVIHGHQAQWDAWARYAIEMPPVRPLCMYPDLKVLESLIAPDIAAVRERTGVDTALRGMLPAEVCADPANRPVLELLIAGGMEIRTLQSVPSLVYVDDGLYAAVPVNWGEHPPSSLLIVRNPTVVSALAYVMETQWALATPFESVEDGWQPVLRLLAQGLSDRAIAASLGGSVRTVQRRITEAMSDLGVSSRFELGVAWAHYSGSGGERQPSGE
jgi:hypothetical protein